MQIKATLYKEAEVRAILVTFGGRQAESEMRRDCRKMIAAGEIDEAYITIDGARSGIRELAISSEGYTFY